MTTRMKMLTSELENVWESGGGLERSSDPCSYFAS